MTTKTRKVHVDEFRLADSSELAVASNGELNASDKKDLLGQISKVLSAMSTGSNVVTDDDVRKEQAAAQNARKAALAAAFEDEKQLRELGEIMSQELYLAANRDGFARRFLTRTTLGKGNIPHMTLRRKNIVAVVATSMARMETQLVRDKEFFPPEFYIRARLFVEKRDIDRTNADVLQEKYIEGMEAVMVQEDRVWRSLAQQATGLANEKTIVSGTMTVQALGTFRNKVARWDIPAQYWLIANDLWTDVTADTGFQQVIDPVSKFELLKTGKLGTILGLEVISDAYRHPEHRVLNQGEQWIIGSPINHGSMTDRGGLDVEPLTTAIEAVPGKGWDMTETISMVIANARSVAEGSRV